MFLLQSLASKVLHNYIWSLSISIIACLRMDLACDFPIKINVTDANLCGFYIMMHAFHMCLKLIMNCNRLNI